jgi:hypothetical protein
MATIADDDDRLLVRIGYTPVSVPSPPLEHYLRLFTGATKTFFKMVYRFIRHLNSRCIGFSPSNLWCPNEFRRSSDSSMGMVHWQHHGILYSQFRYVRNTPKIAIAKSLSSCRISIRIPNSWRNVLCYKTRCAA